MGMAGVRKREPPEYKTGGVEKLPLVQWEQFNRAQPCTFPCISSTVVCWYRPGSGLTAFAWVARHEKEPSATGAQLNSQFLSGNHPLASWNILGKGCALAGQKRNFRPSIRVFVAEAKPVLGNRQRNRTSGIVCVAPASHCSCQWQTEPPNNFSSLSWQRQWWHSCFLTIKTVAPLCHSSL